MNDAKGSGCAFWGEGKKLLEKITFPYLIIFVFLYATRYKLEKKWINMNLVGHWNAVEHVVFYILWVGVQNIKSKLTITMYAMMDMKQKRVNNGWYKEFNSS